MGLARKHAKSLVRHLEGEFAEMGMDPIVISGKNDHVVIDRNDREFRICVSGGAKDCSMQISAEGIGAIGILSGLPSDEGDFAGMADIVLNACDDLAVPASQGEAQ